MSILQEVLSWSQGLPAWQSDALARLLGKQALTADDLDDLFALLKAAQGSDVDSERDALYIDVKVRARTGEPMIVNRINADRIGSRV